MSGAQQTSLGCGAVQAAQGPGADALALHQRAQQRRVLRHHRAQREPACVAQRPRVEARGWGGVDRVVGADRGVLHAVLPGGAAGKRVAPSGLSQYGRQTRQRAPPSPAPRFALGRGGRLLGGQGLGVGRTHGAGEVRGRQGVVRAGSRRLALRLGNLRQQQL